MRKTLQAVCMLALATLLVANAFGGTPVSVVVTGEVEFAGGPLSSQMSPGDPVNISFLLDSDNFVNGAMFPTRGYAVDQSSFLMTTGPTNWGCRIPTLECRILSCVTTTRLSTVSSSEATPTWAFSNGLALDQSGLFDQFRVRYLTTYGGDTLSSLDIVDAVGTYDFDGLTVFGFGILDGGQDAAGFVFEQMTISIVPEPSSIGLLLIGLVGCIRRVVRSISPEPQCRYIRQDPERHSFRVSALVQFLVRTPTSSRSFRSKAPMSGLSSRTCPR